MRTEMIKMGARGISVMFASGDSGTDCTDDGLHFLPSFPADIDVITGVSGVGDDQGQVCDYISGGGFSNFFARPAYQAAAVVDYLTHVTSAMPPKSYYNGTSRAYPVRCTRFGCVCVCVCHDNALTNCGGCSCGRFRRMWQRQVSLHSHIQRTTYTLLLLNIVVSFHFRRREFLGGDWSGAAAGRWHVVCVAVVLGRRRAGQRCAHCRRQVHAGVRAMQLPHTHAHAHAGPLHVTLTRVAVVSCFAMCSV